MSFRREIRVSELADRQIDEADDWWRRNREKAPEAIAEELERVGRLLALQPYFGKRATNVKLSGVRRIHIERIHYDVYYRVIGDPEIVEIVAFWGTRRESGPPI